jgi:hypothetical protein
MERYQDQLPDLNRLSIVVSTILLAYTLTRFISIPAQEVEFSILGVFFSILVNFSTLVSLLVAGLTASGTAWLMYDHPASNGYTSTAVHWLLPSLTSLVLMLAIAQLPFGPTWWLAAAASGLVLMLVFSAEYAVLDRANLFYTPAEMVITALSVVLFLILAISLHASGTRLFYRVPVLSIAALLVYLRVIHLRQEGRWALAQGSVSFLLIGEIAAGLHYWPAGSIAFGIALTGPLYALIEFSDYLPSGSGSIRFEEMLWPIIILALSWVVALLL